MHVTAATQLATIDGPPDWFTGRVRIETIAEEPAPSRLRATRVSFAARARTAWHTHPAGQTLHILTGIARVQSRGGPVRELGPGDTAYIAPGEWHWHGANPAGPMSHLALQDADHDGGEAEWGPQVSDSDYGQPYGGEGVAPFGEREVQRAELAEARIDSSTPIGRARLMRVDLETGQATGRHRHPCDVIGYLLSGLITFQLDGEPAHTLHPGDAFHEPRERIVTRFDNPSPTEPASFLAYYLLDDAQDDVIEFMPR